MLKLHHTEMAHLDYAKEAGEEGWRGTWLWHSDVPSSCSVTPVQYSPADDGSARRLILQVPADSAGDGQISVHGVVSFSSLNYIHCIDKYHEKQETTGILTWMQTQI